MIKPVEWLDNPGIVRLLDQSRLPHRKVFINYSDYKDVAAAIKEMRVRGAPAIGVAAAYGIALGAKNLEANVPEVFLERLEEIIKTFEATRPTAVNLFKAAGQMRAAVKYGASPEDIKTALVQQAISLHQKEEESNISISKSGAGLLGSGATVLTHCNAGSLATAAYGTALGIIRFAHNQGKKISVFSTETRPLLQGARLTTWELKEWGIPVTLITDSMAGHFLSRGNIDCVIVGADRIAANGDTANKIGTYTLAVLARENGIPFYVAAPTTTIDPSLPSGKEIPIEQRKSEEVTHVQEVGIAPEGTQVQNPAFDITPHRYITAIITERGIIREPFGEGIKKAT
ncbi:MAG: S-methyl-5-thioribose-1-phosphate isomerase [Dehalococcoidia bacterium]|nr:S-methyl-5-thioribose-1-phosphate isomerase [Dehalococcoidia bacterium]